MAAKNNNFSRASARDAQCFGCARPGFPDKPVEVAAIDEWVAFLKDRGIKRVLSLLGDDEVFEFYPKLQLDEYMRTAFGPDKYARTSVFVDGARDVMTAAIDAANSSREPIVMHCSGGEGRAGLGVGLWLVTVYGLAPEDAAREIDEEVNRTTGVARRVNAPKLAHLVSNGSMIGFQKR